MEQASILINSIPEISAIYYALLQAGYPYCAMGREAEHVRAVQRFRSPEGCPAFFYGVSQSSCEVYPFWPRAAILETAVFFLRRDHAGFADYDGFRQQILSAAPISDADRGQPLWDWIAGFPAALADILSRADFQRYFQWERAWVEAQNAAHKEELAAVARSLALCSEAYRSPVRRIRIVINPIKCIYSADYQLIGDAFVFSSGLFDAASIIHEFLHHVVHPYMTLYREAAGNGTAPYPGIDASYYLDGGPAGRLNALEEYAVRRLTEDVRSGQCPKDITAYIDRLL